MEPPSPIAKPSNLEAGAKSDDPLSNCIFMILGDTTAPADGDGARALCAWSAQRGFFYVGITTDIES